MTTKPTNMRRLMTAAATLGLLLASFVLAAPATTAQVCLPNQPCLSGAECSMQMAPNQAVLAVMGDALQVATQVCVMTSEVIETCNGHYTVTVQATNIGPLDTAMGEARCGGEHVAACTVQFTDVTTGWTCNDKSELVSGGILECVPVPFDRPDGVTLEFTVTCAEPPIFPEW